MRQVKEEVCLYYMGFGICARGLHADKKGCCAGCSQYKASGVKIGKKKQGGNGKEGIEVTDENGKRNVQWGHGWYCELHRFHGKNFTGDKTNL